MRVLYGIAYFKSKDPWYTTEKTGVKPNTLRVVTDDEFTRLKTAERIIITGPNGHSFTRAIQGLFDVTDALDVTVPDGHRLVLICWHPMG